jgi:hypothetical protein
LLVTLGVAYLAQLPTPLRMNTDAIAYLSIAASFNDGHGLTWHGYRSHFPAGYPLIVALLERMGCGTSAGLVAFNLASLAVAAACGVWLARRWVGLPPPLSILVAALFLLANGPIRYALIPGSDMPFTALAMVSLVLFTEAENGQMPRRRRWLLWNGAVIVSILAIGIRLVGVALLPAALWSMMAVLRVRGSPVRLLPVVGVVVLCVLGWLVSRTAYFHEGVALLDQHGWATQLILNLRQRFAESAVLLFSLRDYANNPWHPALVAIGAPCFAIIVLLLATRWRGITAVDVYLAAYLVLLILWPYPADVRFWLPVQLPVYALIAHALVNVNHASVRWISALWMLAFATLGTIALARTTAVSYSGDRFDALYDQRYFRDTYRAAASRSDTAFDRSKVDPELLAMLRRFDRSDFGARR